MFHLIANKDDNNAKHDLSIDERNVDDKYRLGIKEGDVIFFLSPNQNIVSRTVKKIISKYHSFGMGYALRVLLDDDKEISTFYCYPSPEDIVEILINRIATEERQPQTNVQIIFPTIENIRPTSLFDEIVSP